jgi:hypothetical protein
MSFLPILPNEVAKPNYSLAMALKDARVRQWRMSRHPVHDDGVMSPAKWKRYRLAAIERKRKEEEAALLPILPPAPVGIETLHPCQATQIIRIIVAAHFKTSPAQIMAKRRFPVDVWARQVAMYLARDLTLLSLPQIGHFFGGYDHTNVLHAVRKVARERAADPTGKLSAISAEAAWALGREH